jgi:PTS system mannose-specific IID component
MHADRPEDAADAQGVEPPPPRAPESLRPRDFGFASARLLHVQALLTPERMQGPGFAFALDPILRRLYPDPGPRAEALARHTSYVSTHPVLAGYVLGAAARLEEDRARGGATDGPEIDALKRALASPLAAMGDPLFWVVLRPLAGLVGVLGIALFGPADPSLPDIRVLLCPLLLLLTYNAVALPIRWRGVRVGYAGAAAPAEILRSLRLADWRETLERGGALLYGALVMLVLFGIQVTTRSPTGVGALIAGIGPLALGFVAARSLLRRSPSASVETSLAVLGLAAAASLAL